MPPSCTFLDRVVEEFFGKGIDHFGPCHQQRKQNFSRHQYRHGAESLARQPLPRPQQCSNLAWFDSSRRHVVCRGRFGCGLSSWCVDLVSFGAVRSRRLPLHVAAQRRTCIFKKIVQFGRPWLLLFVAKIVQGTFDVWQCVHITTPFTPSNQCVGKQRWSTQWPASYVEAYGRWSCG